MININCQFYDGVIIKPSLDDVLEHHGVKGMKWGFRKRRVLKGRANRQINTGNIARAKTNRRRNILKTIGRAGLLTAGGGAVNAASRAIVNKETSREQILRNFGQGSAATAGLIGVGVGVGAGAAAVRNRKIKKQLRK